MKFAKFLLTPPVCAISAVLLGVCAANAAVYLKADAPDGGDGTSWSTAYNSLDTALTNLPEDKTIYIAKGYYGCKNLTNHAFDTLKIYGGYLGETDGDMTRDTAEYQTIIGGAATMPTGNWTHVVPKADGFGVTTEASDHKLFVDGKLNLPAPTGDYDAYRYSGTSFAFRINVEIVADGIVFFGFGREGTPGGSAIGVKDNATKATINDCVFAGGSDLQRAILWIGTTAEESTVTKCRFYYNQAQYATNPNVVGSATVVFDACEFVGSVADSDAPVNGAFQSCKSISNSLFTHNLLTQSAAATTLNKPLIDLGTGTMTGCVITNNLMSVRNSAGIYSGQIFAMAASSGSVAMTLVAKNRLEVDAHDGASYALAATCNMMASGGPYTPHYEDMVFAENVVAAKMYSLESGSFALGILGGSTASRTINETILRCTFLDNAFEVDAPDGVEVTCANGVLVSRQGANITETIEDCVFKSAHAAGVYDIAQYATTGTKPAAVSLSAFVDTAVDVHDQAILSLSDVITTEKCAIQKKKDTIDLVGTPLLFRGEETGYELLHHPPTVTLLFSLGNAGVFNATGLPTCEVNAVADSPFPPVPVYTLTRECTVKGWSVPEVVPEVDSSYVLDYAVEGVTFIRVAEGGTGDGTSWENPYGDLATAYAAAAQVAGPVELQLQNGTYYLSAPVDLLPNVTVCGFGEAVIAPSASAVQWAFTDANVVETLDECVFKDVTISGFNYGAISAWAGKVAKLTVENCRFVNDGTKKDKGVCRTICLKNGVLDMRDSYFEDDFFGVYLYCDSVETGCESVIEGCTFKDISGGQQCAAIRLEGYGSMQLKSSVFDHCVNDSQYTGAAAAVGFEIAEKTERQSVVSDCEFKNCVSEGTCYSIFRAFARTGHPLDIVRCRFRDNVVKSGGVIVFQAGQTFLTDCSFTGNTLTTSAASGCLASVATMPQAANAQFVNCTFDGNGCTTENPGATVGTISQAHHNGYLSLVNCVFCNSTFAGAAADTCAEIRLAKEGTYAFDRTQIILTNTILWNEAADYRALFATDTATATVMAFADCRIRNFDFDDYSTFLTAPVPGNKGNWGYVINVTAEDPKLLPGKVGENGAYAVGVDAQTRKTGAPVRRSDGGDLYFREDGLWRNVASRMTTYTDAQAAAFGVAIDGDPLEDAWGVTRARRHVTLGPVENQRGLMLLVR